MKRPQLHRLAETRRRPVAFVLDGEPAEALEGDTLLTAVLTNAGKLRLGEFDHTPRAGFCLMGACQDCWLKLETGERLRACTVYVAEGMRVLTGNGDGV
jgi:NADH dehydrogenase/NADH:ubiquinone oxidoreductase subunit G